MFETVCALVMLASLWLFVMNHGSKSFWSLPIMDQIFSVFCVLVLIGCVGYFLIPFWQLFKLYFAIPYGV